MQLRAWARPDDPPGRNVENPPPTTIWPLAWIASESTVLSAFGSKLVSREPSTLNLAMWLRVEAPVGVQPGRVIAGDRRPAAAGLDRREQAANDDLAVRLERHDADDAVR